MFTNENIKANFLSHEDYNEIFKDTPQICDGIVIKDLINHYIDQAQQKIDQHLSANCSNDMCEVTWKPTRG